MSPRHTYVVEYDLGGPNPVWVKGETVRCDPAHFSKLISWVRRNSTKDTRIKRAEHLIHEFTFTGRRMRRVGQ